MAIASTTIYFFHPVKAMKIYEFDICCDLICLTIKEVSLFEYPTATLVLKYPVVVFLPFADIAF